MSLLSIITEACQSSGMEAPASAIGSTDPTVQKMVQFSIETVEELRRRHGWSRLVDDVNFPSAQADFLVGADFDRLVPGSGIVVNGVPIRCGLSQSEWLALPARTGTPRYGRTVDKTVSIWPTPTGTDTIKVNYYSAQPFRTEADAVLPTWVADNDYCKLPEDLITLGVIVRHRRDIGQDFSDQLAEFEAMFADYARIDGGEPAK